MRHALQAPRGMKVGLLGGSFDPAHSGHAHVAETARARLGLQCVWWLVSPQNPLKPKSSPLQHRLASARSVARGPHMVVTDIETRLKTQFTIDTLRALKRRFPGVHFVWLMGADNLAGFERWRGWQEIARLIPICVVSRPGAGPKARLGRLASRFPHARLKLEKAALCPGAVPPAWVYIPARWNPLSSTALRNAGAGLTID
ncbi:nicotinate-nucleotide adenylyltransferase [Candidatus Phycosocius bacilliformis]|uniref:Probable nicotinate-nucleotide adenylyltransferase n=1 Tax=Candidatus Phycosocius bacilliformis TaxID=1445552 RepID=A0A2P2EAA6_9PROT|nr:nicotinate-nucleotide adenylyltransferase [Candidatus Phycosocius bacilliformis]GBF57992.1 nicotinate-nucleotide adenylyltransferase [Candidatus Phycosocius bacilliformis]